MEGSYLWESVLERLIQLLHPRLLARVRHLLGKEFKILSIVSEVGFSIQLPSFLDMTRNDFLWLQCFDQVKCLDPCIVYLQGFYFFDPAVRGTSAQRVTRLRSDIPDMCAASIYRISTDDRALCGKPKQRVIDGISLEWTQEYNRRVDVTVKHKKTWVERCWLSWLRGNVFFTKYGRPIFDLFLVTS